MKKHFADPMSVTDQSLTVDGVVLHGHRDTKQIHRFGIADCLRDQRLSYPRSDVAAKDLSFMSETSFSVLQVRICNDFDPAHKPRIQILGRFEGEMSELPIGGAVREIKGAQIGPGDDIVRFALNRFDESVLGERRFLSGRRSAGGDGSYRCSR